MAEKKTKLTTVMSKIDSIVNSYTDQSSHEERKKIINIKTGMAGIIVSENIPNPENNSGNGFLVQWLNIGGQTWYPAKELDKVNSDIKFVSQELTDLFSSAIEVNQ